MLFKLIDFMPFLFSITASLLAFIIAFGIVAIFLILLALATTAFWIWMLIDCLSNRQTKDDAKIIWALLIFFLHFVGAIVYYIAEYLPRKKAAQSPPIQPFVAPVAASTPPPQSYSAPYQQGYRSPSEQARADTPPTPTAWKRYEEPHASYPDQSDPPLQSQS